MMREQKKRWTDQAGFTIVELMIATLVFSTILILATTAVLQVTRTYYKGVTEANTQTVARNIINTIGQAIQFDGGNVQPTVASAPRTAYAFCVGNVQFQYLLGSQLATAPTGSQTANALLENPNDPGCTAGSIGTMSPSSSTVELLTPKMRLSNLTVTSLGNNLYQITVSVVYGDDDLLSNPFAANAACIGVQAGTQFCSVSQLSTTVLKRVQ